MTFLRRNSSNSDRSPPLLEGTRSRRIRYVPLRISSSCCAMMWAGTWYSCRTREKISTDVSNSSGITAFAPREIRSSTSATYRVRTRMVSPGLARRATATARRVAIGSEMASTSVLARSTPTRSRISGLFTSPKKTGSPASRPSRTSASFRSTTR
jgi:hypothetical protein